jgi:hypothetical protein
MCKIDREKEYVQSVGHLKGKGRGGEVRNRRLVISPTI